MQSAHRWLVHPSTVAALFAANTALGVLTAGSYGCNPRSEIVSDATDAAVADSSRVAADAAPADSKGVPAVAGSSALAPVGRLVILGFDGVDPRHVDELVAAGRLPNIQKLGKQGYRGTMATTNPPQSPVAWAAFATGSAAGEHGIFDFVGRDAQTYMPFVATTRIKHAEVHGQEVTPALATNLRRGSAFWDALARAGLAARTLCVPYAYPPDPAGAKSLAGLGTPDVRGTNSTFTLLTTDKARVQGEPPAGGQLALLEPAGRGAWRAEIEGPRISVDGKRAAATVEIRVSERGERLEITVGAESVATLGVGETSGSVVLTFAPAPTLQVRAATRLTVHKTRPHPELYVEPLSILPSEPYLPLSTPPVFAAQLWQSLGPWKTVGWVDDTSALGAGAMDERQFLREAAANMVWQQRALLAALDEKSDKLVVSVFTSPDRIAHMFYRYLDPAHPQNPAQAKAHVRAKTKVKNGTSAKARSSKGVASSVVPAELASALDDAYVTMDHIVGEVQNRLGADDTLVIVSDHGFSSFRRGVNLNTWLLQQGWLALVRGVSPGSARDFFQDVDWSRTQAYALGTGGIYLNLKGREAQGSVSAADAPALVDQMAKKLLTLRDGQRDVVAAVYRGDALFAGPARAGAPELRVALIEGYRASWATTLGGLPAQVVEDNVKKWSGDHASSRPEDVPAFLLSSRPLAVGDPKIEDISATAFAYAGVAAPSTNIGRPLFGKELTHASR